MEVELNQKTHSTDELILTSVEKEVSILLSARQAIKSMVNRSMLSIGGDAQTGMTIRPSTLEASYLFSSLLVDFMSPINPAFGNFRSHIEGLKHICNSPHFNFDKSIIELQEGLRIFDEWLSCEVVFQKVWLPSSSNEELHLKMRREEFLRICGDVSKHSTLRLSRTAKRILDVLQRSNPKINLSDAFAGIDDFYSWFHNDVFHYHLTKICEMLNNISWGIQTYLTDQYHSSYIVDLEKSRERKFTAYSFHHPVEVTTPLGKYYYWELMNEIRAKPIIEKFKTDKYLERRY